MSFVDWPGNLPVGVPAIDADHEALVRILNDLHEIVVTGSGGRDGADLLLRFVRRARNHFRREEDLMAAHGYPATAAHRQEHAELLTVLSFLLDAVRTGQAMLDADALDYLRRWLCGHIENSDTAVAHFLLRRTAGQP